MTVIKIPEALWSEAIGKTSGGPQVSRAAFARRVFVIVSLVLSVIACDEGGGSTDAGPDAPLLDFPARYDGTITVTERWGSADDVSTTTVTFQPTFEREDPHDDLYASYLLTSLAVSGEIVETFSGEGGVVTTCTREGGPPGELGPIGSMVVREFPSGSGEVAFSAHASWYGVATKTCVRPGSTIVDEGVPFEVAAFVPTPDCSEPGTANPLTPVEDGDLENLSYEASVSCDSSGKPLSVEIAATFTASSPE